MAELIGKCACKEIGCEIGKSGECFNQLTDPEKCSHFYWLEDVQNQGDEEEDEKEDDKGKVTPPKIKLISGEALELEDLTRVTHSFDAKLIAFVGESDSGKTTLLASIFDIFQINNFNNYHFAGSLTQVGFERRCHKSRKESNLQKPATDKTAAKKFNFLHLATRKKDRLQPVRHFLLSDISGEKLSHASSSTSSMQELDILKFADLVVVIIDGSTLSDIRHRQTTINKTVRFLQKATDEKMITSKTKVCISISKMDLLEGSDFNIEEKIRAVFLSKFKDKLLELIFVDLAARPKAASAKYRFGSGIEDLLDEMNALFAEKTLTISHSYKYGKRSFENFKFTHGE